MSKYWMDELDEVTLDYRGRLFLSMFRFSQTALRRTHSRSLVPAWDPESAACFIHTNGAYTSHGFKLERMDQQAAGIQPHHRASTSHPRSPRAGSAGAGSAGAVVDPIPLPGGIQHQPGDPVPAKGSRSRGSSGGFSALVPMRGIVTKVRTGAIRYTHDREMV